MENFNEFYPYEDGLDHIIIHVNKTYQKDDLIVTFDLLTIPKDEIKNLENLGLKIIDNHFVVVVDNEKWLKFIIENV